MHYPDKMELQYLYTRALTGKSNTLVLILIMTTNSIFLIGKSHFLKPYKKVQKSPHRGKWVSVQLRISDHPRVNHPQALS